jgi:hypothetical protein
MIKWIRTSRRSKQTSLSLKPRFQLLPAGLTVDNLVKVSKQEIDAILQVIKEKEFFKEIGVLFFRKMVFSIT